MKIFNWNIDLTILWMMPPETKIAVHYAWIKALLNPVKSNYSDFLLYRRAEIYDAYITGQTFQLRRLLNDSFDPDLKRIVIIHSFDDDLTLYLDEENQPNEDIFLYLDQENQPAAHITLYLDGEPAGVLPVDFRIVAPLSLQAMENEIFSLVSTKALASKTYDIIFR
ncbi:MAG: hypothetical protein NW226_17460 [Microscillaceae bacterium]|nr:hypothetical protein [Microscillaceae bacterium]